MLPIRAAVFCLLTLACRGSAGAGEVEAGSVVSGASGRASIVYQPEVRLVEHADGRGALVGVSSEGSLLLFEAERPELRSLQPGQVLVIKGLLARKVLATEMVGSRIAVLTAPAGLGDAVRDGSIELTTPVRFGAGQATSSQRVPRSSMDRLADWALPPAHAQSPDAEKIKAAERGGDAEAMKSLAMGAVKGVFEGWETSFAATPSKGRLNLALTLTKDVGGFRAVISGDGYLADFDMSSGIGVRRGIVERLELTHRRLNGLVNFHWEVAKDSPGPEGKEDRIKLPAAISIPLYRYLDGLPLFLEISAAMIIQPAITGGKQYSQGSFRVTFDGEQHFRIKEGTIAPDGRVSGNIEFLRSQNVSALAPLGMVTAFAAPRIELTFGTSKLLSMGDLKEAAEKVDFIARQLVKQVFGQEGLDRLKASPMGGFDMSTAVKNAVASDAVGYIEVVSTAGMSHTGFSAITPCTRTDLGIIVKVGASAQTFGQQLGETKRDVFNRTVVRVDPPGTRLCEAI